MSMHLHKKDDDIGFLFSEDQDQYENSSQEERLPEFDVIGTALNDI